MVTIKKSMISPTMNHGKTPCPSEEQICFKGGIIYFPAV